MTTSTLTTTKNILHIRMKGLQSQPDFERAEGPDEDGVVWITWYLEKNTCDERQKELIWKVAGLSLQDILIDDDIADEVSDHALLRLASRLRGTQHEMIKPSQNMIDQCFCASGNTAFLRW
jgi:hypothetical protein